MDLYLNQAYSGLGLGAVLLLVALGLALTFGQMGVINMAHGEFIMAGAFTAHCMGEAISNPSTAFLVAIPVSFVVAGLIGLALEATLLSRLHHRPMDTLLVTYGIALILQQIARDQFGTQLAETPSPSWLSGSWTVGGVDIKYPELFIILFTAATVAGLAVLLKLTPLGRRIRATVQNRDLAETVGISTRTIDRVTFLVGSGLAGVAGVCVTLIAGTSPTMGSAYIIFAFVIVVLGGIGQIWGTVIAALAFGITKSMLATYFSNDSIATVIVFLAIVAFLQIRPQGIFTVRTRSLA